MTANGMIATEKGDAPWSDVIWEGYYKIAKQFKAVILGRKTYELMKEANEFQKIGSPFTVVVSRGSKKADSKTAFVKSPKDAMKLLKEMKFDKVMIGGGGKLNASFMKENLVDEIILDIEPMIFGKGIELFNDAPDFRSDLQLIKVKKLSDNEIQLHYKVVK